MSTPKQKKAAIKTSENIRNPRPAPIGQVLRESGYSEAVSLRPSSVTKSKGYIEELEPMLKRHNVTKEQYVKNIGDAMTANRVAMVAGDFYETEVPDHAMRLSANKQAKELLKFEGLEENKDLITIKDNVDEVELTKLILRKN